MEEWPFTGREAELDRGRRALERGRGILVCGETGAGKSALCRRVLREHAASDERVVVVAGKAVGSTAPFEAFAALIGDSAPALTVVGMAHRVQAHARGRHLTLMADDIDRLDEQSSRVVLQLALEGAVVIATARDAVHLAAVAELWTSGRCERIDLSGLVPDDVGHLLEAALGAPVPSAVVAVFADRSRGNPLLLRELVGAALAGGQLARIAEGWRLSADPPLGPSVYELVAARLAAVPPRQRAALELIACGEPMQYSVAAALVGEGALTELEAARLIRVDAGLETETVATGHPLYGEVLRGDMPLLRARRLRLRLARLLEGTRRPHDLVRAALWRWESGAWVDPERLLQAARAAQSISLETAERLARAAHATQRSLAATLLLAEILIHQGRAAEGQELLEGLPSEALEPADRERIVYCRAVGGGLLAGDSGHAADAVEALIADLGDASGGLRALHAALLAFDARFSDALAAGAPLADDVSRTAPVRVLAAIGAVGATFWTGRFGATVARASAVLPLARGAEARAAAPYSAASLALLAVCAQAESGRLDESEAMARRLSSDAPGDSFTAPRADYCLGRVALARGHSREAAGSFRRCIAGLDRFDAFMRPHVGALLARAEAAHGNATKARAILRAECGSPVAAAYAPDSECAEAAVLAAEGLIGRAADRAAWAAALAADRQQWSSALWAAHDAARYGAPQAVAAIATEAAAHVEGPYAAAVQAHIAALSQGAGGLLDEVAFTLMTLGSAGTAVEASLAAAIAHAGAADGRAARRSAWRAQEWAAETDTVTPWLIGSPEAPPLSRREREVALLARSGRSDAQIAALLQISVRTVQSHLEHAYRKLGIERRTQLDGLAARDEGPGPERLEGVLRWGRR